MTPDDILIIIINILFRVLPVCFIVFFILLCIIILIWSLIEGAARNRCLRDASGELGLNFRAMPSIACYIAYRETYPVEGFYKGHFISLMYIYSVCNSSCSLRIALKSDIPIRGTLELYSRSYMSFLCLIGINEYPVKDNDFDKYFIIKAKDVPSEVLNRVLDPHLKAKFINLIKSVTQGIKISITKDTMNCRVPVGIRDKKIVINIVNLLADMAENFQKRSNL